MSAIKLTKAEMRNQQLRLSQLERYLPTLQLKKAMLQAEVSLSEQQITEVEKKKDQAKEAVEAFARFFVEKVSWDLPAFAEVMHVEKHYENIAGVEIPLFEGVLFQEANYFLFDTPPWLDAAVAKTRMFVSLKEEKAVLEEKKRALEKELRDVSIRVNLFEKILIPRSKENIKRIRIFLSDQQLASVAQAKVAKLKIAQREERV